MKTDSFVVTHPEVIWWELDVAENNVAIKQAIIENMRAGIELNAALWKRWAERAKACLAQSEVLREELANAARVPSVTLFCEPALVHQKLELSRLEQSVADRYDECYATMEDALSAIRDADGRRVLVRECYEKFESARTVLLAAVERFRRTFERFLAQQGLWDDFQSGAAPTG